MNLVIKLLIFIVVLLLLMVGLFIMKATNFDFESINKKDPVENNKKIEDTSTDRVKKINDSINQREERIKSLKEVGKQLGGWKILFFSLQ